MITLDTPLPEVVPFLGAETADFLFDLEDDLVVNLCLRAVRTYLVVVEHISTPDDDPFKTQQALDNIVRRICRGLAAG